MSIFWVEVSSGIGLLNRVTSLDYSLPVSIDWTLHVPRMIAFRLRAAFSKHKRELIRIDSDENSRESRSERDFEQETTIFN